ncbi:MAG: polysaccharide biosynthesis C-terminal domain-containing protein [Byssovorax sp.]
MLKNIGSNWALAIIQILVMVQLTPVQVKALGAGPNDTWLTVAALTGYLGLLVLGIPMAAVRFIAKHVAAKDLAKTNESIASCLAMTLIAGAGAMTIGSALSFFFEHTYVRSEEWQVLGPVWIDQARIAYWISTVTVALGFTAQLPFGIMEAHHDFVAANIVKITGLFFRLTLTVFLLRAYPSLVVLALIQAGAQLAEFTAALILIRRRFPGVRFGLQGAERHRMKEILGFSMFVMLLNMGTLLSFRTDVLVINANLKRAHLDLTAGTVFDIGNKFFPPLIGLVIGIASVIMPTAAKLQAQDKVPELGPIFLKWSKISYSLSLLVGIYLMVLGPEFVSFWMGESFAQPAGEIIRVLMASYLIFLPARGVAMPVLMGLGNAAKPSIGFLVMGVANFVMSWVLVEPMGIYGVAVGTAVPCVLFALALIVLACQELGVSLFRYLHHVGTRATLGAIPATLFLLWLKLGLHAFPEGRPRWVAFIPLFFSGIGAVVIFALTSIFFVYKNDPDVDLHAKVLRRLPRALGGGKAS